MNNGSTVVGTTIADGSGNWQINNIPLINGADYDLTATANDAAGTSTPSTPLVFHDNQSGPAISNAGNIVSYTELQAPPVIDAALTATDVESANLASARVSITGGTFFTGDTLAATTTGTSITASYDAATGVLTLSGTDTLAHYQSVLESVAFSSSSHNPTNFGNDTSRTISWVVNDGTINSTAQTTTIAITPVNDAPVVNANGGSLSYTENQVATAIDTSLLVSDVDSANLTGATVSITGNFASGQDVLGFTNQNGITGSYTAASGVLVLSGTATVAQYQAALESVTLLQLERQPLGRHPHHQLPGQ